MYILSPLIATTVTVALVFLLLRSNLSVRIRDVPNARSLHAVPTPRIGGIGLMGGVSAGWLLGSHAPDWWMFLPVSLLFAVSLFDDMASLPVGKRLAAQMLAAVMLVLGSGIGGQHGIIAGLFMGVAVVWMTNLYNFMDGSDGLAGGMAVSGFLAYGVAAVQAGNEPVATLSLTVSAAAFGFLFFNFPPAKVFMGDAGSIPLGFMAAGLGLTGWQQGCWGLWFPLLVFSPFIADATVTLVKRALRGAKVTEAHREHYYQRAIQLGYGHRRVALAAYGLMIVTGGVAVCWREAAFPWAALSLVAIVLLAPMLWIDRRWQEQGIR